MIPSLSCIVLENVISSLATTEECRRIELAVIDRRRQLLTEAKRAKRREKIAALLEISREFQPEMETMDDEHFFMVEGERYYISTYMELTGELNLWIALHRDNINHRMAARIRISGDYYQIDQWPADLPHPPDRLCKFVAFLMKNGYFDYFIALLMAATVPVKIVPQIMS